MTHSVTGVSRRPTYPQPNRAVLREGFFKQVVTPFHESRVISSVLKPTAQAVKSIRNRGSIVSKVLIPEALGLLVLWGAGNAGLKAASAGLQHLPVTAEAGKKAFEFIKTNPELSGMLSYLLLQGQRFFRKP